MLWSAEAERARSTAIRIWQARPSAPFAQVLEVVLRGLGISTTNHPENLSQGQQRRYFDTVRIVATAKVVSLGGGALRELRELEAAVQDPSG
jgi:hypothetical protein